ncbi:MAG: hypothetical protein ACR2N3_08995 [Pyrinomonadaceae bacterium]
MIKTKSLKKLLLFNLALFLVVLSFAISAMSQDKDWISSEKKDDLETFYRVEKVGTDTYEVTVRIDNNRPKTINVEVMVLYKTDTNYSGNIFLPRVSSNRAFFDRCQELIPSNGSRTCKSVQINAKKITGVKIIQWCNAYGKPCIVRRQELSDHGGL